MDTTNYILYSNIYNIILYYIYVLHISTNYVVILRACEHVKTELELQI
jgi:hypothetical protein